MTGFPVVAPPLPGRALSDQRWRSVGFAHWEVDPELVAPLLPRGTTPDTLNGATYVGLVPFIMERAGLGRGLPVPWLGTFPETNVRLYSVDKEGHHGVVFLSLEASRLVTAMCARWGYRLPYTWASMRVQSRGDVWTYTRRRRYPRPRVTSALTLRVGEPVVPSEVDVFLTARWGLHSMVAGRTLWTPNTHPPWPLYSAQLLYMEDGLLRAAGIPVTGAPTVPVRWSPGVRTQFGMPSIVRAGAKASDHQ